MPSRSALDTKRIEFGLAIAATQSLSAGREKDLTLKMTCGMVAFSIVVRGLTVGRMFKAFTLQHPLGRA